MQNLSKIEKTNKSETDKCIDNSEHASSFENESETLRCNENEIELTGRPSMDNMMDGFQSHQNEHFDKSSDHHSNLTLL